MKTARPLAYALLWSILCTMLLPAPAYAEAIGLSNVFPSEEILIVGQPLTITYEAGASGMLRVEARPLAAAGDFIVLEERSVQPGAGEITWDGTMESQPVEMGQWQIRLTLNDDASGEASSHSAIVQIADAAPKPTIIPDALRPQRTPSPDRQLSAFPDPHTNCFWNMDLENLDPYDPEDQAVIWGIMMQPVTVLDVGPKEHVYPLVSPAANPKDAAANITGQLHGSTQGVHVIEHLENGWSLIEAYANDGYNAPAKVIRNYTGKLIHGYVKTDKLKTVVPNEKIGILIDKLTQRLYVFQDGKMTGELLVSTGYPTKNQPYTETPAGEFLTDSWVGEFVNGNMFCDMAIRINGGVLLHEVPYKARADGGRDYSAFVQYLGQKASHGCVRIQKDRNAEGMNMEWLWNNLKRNAKVLIWDDQGRSLPPPDPALPVYYNPNNGKNYHLKQNCPGVKDRFLPLTEFMYGELNMAPYDQLTPCSTCKPPERHEDEAAYFVPDDIVGDYTETAESDEETPDTL